jgi:hypothetical protein
MSASKIPWKSRSGLLLASAGALVVCPVWEAQADPVPVGPGVFCIRITDIERVQDDVSDAAFEIEFELLNWSDTPASGFSLAVNIGTFFLPSGLPPWFGGPPEMVRAFIDPDGRGGPVGGNDIGPGVFDPIAIHSGRGRSDIAGHLNDWGVTGSTHASVTWGTGALGTPIPNLDLLAPLALIPADPASAYMLVPGLGTDGLGDSAIDGGPLPYVNPAPLPFGFFPTGGQPVPDGSGNVLDGFVLTVCDWDEFEMISFNWNFLDALGNPIMNSYGFGTLNLVRLPAAAPLPGGVFIGNTGFGQQPIEFFDSVFEIPAFTRAAATSFAVEFGAAITAPFATPTDNTFGFPITTQTVSPITHPAAPPELIPRIDINFDGVVNGADLGLLLGGWGTVTTNQ